MENDAPVRLIFAGEVLPGFQIDEVRRRFGEAFKIEGAKLATMFSGERTVLKRSLSPGDAARYVSQLQKLGVRIRVEPADAAVPVARPEAQGAPASPAAPASAAPAPAIPALAPIGEEITCPNCGERQPKQVFCRSCTTDMPRGIAAKKEDADRARAERVAARQGGRWSPPGSAVGEAGSGGVVDAPPMIGLNFEGRMGRISYVNAGLLAWAGLAGIGIGAAVLVPMFRSALLLVPLGLAFIVFLIWSIRVTVLRLHDFNRSGWWVLVTLIPYVGFVATLVLLFVPGSAEENDYGEKPRQGNAVIAIVALVVGAIGLAAVVRYSLSAYEGYRQRSARAPVHSEADPAASQRAGEYLRSPAALEAFATYTREPGHKAFATSEGGAYGWRSGQASMREAMSRAMATCEENRKPYTSECELVNVNGQWAQQQ